MFLVISLKTETKTINALLILTRQGMIFAIVSDLSGDLKIIAVFVSAFEDKSTSTFCCNCRKNVLDSARGKLV